MAPQLARVLPQVARKSLKVARARSFERLGSDRYSFPALNGLDRKMLEHLPHTGVFLEVGANDGYSQSNTYFLERRRGWSGILIEPHPGLYRRCKRLRRRSACFNVACTDAAGGMIELLDMDLMSVTPDVVPTDDRAARISVVPEAARISVPATTLSAVIDETVFTRIDFMSVDVEGAELALLSGLDWSRHTPELLLVETRQLGKVTELVQGWMHYDGALSHHDHLFRRVQTQEPTFAAPYDEELR